MAEKKKIKKTLVIGLGGTGATTILYLKKIFMEQFGKIPVAIQFLSLDTDRGTRESSLTTPLLNEKVEIKDDEFLHLGVQNTLETIKASESVKEWWPEGLPALSVRNGTGAIRALGRLAFYAHSHEIIEIVTQKKLKRLDDPSLFKDLEGQGFKLLDGKEIYIVGSLAGGTGSGTFLDTAFLLNHILRDVTACCGFFILPWIFEGLPATPRIGANTYAALKELEYYMGLKYNEHKVIRKFGKDLVEIKRPPFDIVNLIDGRNEQGGKIREAGSSGVKILCELTAKAIVATCGPMGKISDSIIDNIKTILSSETAANWGGKFPYYSSIGASVILYPAEKHFRKLSHFLGLQLIESGINKYRAIEGTGNEDILGKAVEDDVNNYLTEANLREEGDDIINRLIPYGSCSTDFHLPQDLKKRKDIEKELKSLSDANRNRLKEDIEARLAESITPAVEKATADLNKKLDILNEEKGLEYAVKFASALKAKIGGYRDSLRLPEIETHKERIGHLKEDQKKALTNMPKAFGIIDLFSGKADDIIRKYVRLVSDEFNEEMEVARKGKALDVYKEIIVITDDFLRPLKSVTKVLDKLEGIKGLIQKDISGLKTVLLNKEHRYDILVPSFSSKMFVKRTGTGDVEVGTIVGFEEVLRERNIEVNFDRFLKETGLTDKDIMKMKEQELWSRIGRYSEEKLGFIKDVTVEDVLKEEMDGRNDEDYIKKRVTEASNLAIPFWHHRAGTTDYGMRMNNLFIIGVNNYNTILMKSDGEDGRSFLPPTPNAPDFAVTNDPHRIFIYKYTVPLPAYLLVDMDKYRREYHECPTKMTPHIGMDFHLISDDLFPSKPVDLISLKLFSLAYSLGFIETVTKQTGDRIITIKNTSIGKSLYDAFNELSSDQRLKLRDQIRDEIEEQWRRDPQKYEGSISETIKRLEERLENDNEMSLGEAILQYQMSDTLKAFQDSIAGKATVKNFINGIA